MIARAVTASAVSGLLFLSACSSGSVQSHDASPGSAESAGSGNPDPVPTEPTTNCKVTDSRLTEISGMAASIQHPGILWVNNDSGDSARVFALEATTCRVKAVVSLKGVTPWDAEALAVGKNPQGQPVIWFGDIGDNAATKKSVNLYRFAEPAELQDQSVSVTKTTVTYSDGPHDAESLLVSPEPGGRIWVISKRQSVNGSIYELPAGFGWQQLTGVAKPIAEVDWMPTDAAFAPDGKKFAIRTYLGAKQYLGKPPGKDPQDFDLGYRGQGEAITYSFDSAFLYAISEGRNSPLVKLPLPT